MVDYEAMILDIQESVYEGDEDYFVPDDSKIEYHYNPNIPEKYR